MNRARSKTVGRLLSGALAGLLAVLTGTAPALAIDGSEPVSTQVGNGSTAIVELFTGLNIVLDNPLGLTFDDNGTLYFVDRGHNTIFVATGDVAAVVAGTGDALSNGDGGPASAAAVLPSGLAVGPDGSLYFSERATNVIRVIAPDGTISRFAGTGTAASTGDGGQAISASFNSPSGLIFDKEGNLFVGEHSGARIRRIAPNGIITTVVGTGVSGDSGDGGLATAAQIGQPGELAFDRDDNLIFTDTLRSRVRRVDSLGIITTIAGNGLISDFVANRQATSTPLPFPRGLAVDSSGEIYVSSKNRVYKIRHDGRLVPVAGTGTAGSVGEDGPVINAQYDTITSLAISPTDSLITAEATQVAGPTQIHRIRLIQAREDCRQSPVDAKWGTTDRTRAGIYRLYCAYFLRYPDQGGYDYWYSEFTAGKIELPEISDSFAASLEFRNTYGDLSHEEFIDLLYGNMFQRAPDAVGREYWLFVLDTKEATKGQVILQFSVSLEFRNKTGTP